MFRRRLLHRWQTVCKPGSVGLLAQSGRSFLYEHGHPCSLAAYPRCLDRGGRLSPHIWPCSNRGLPCRSCYHERGGLLPHRFTLATRRWRSLFCGTFRHGPLAPSVPRRYLAACPLEPGLSSNRYHMDTNARSSDRLPCRNISRMTIGGEFSEPANDQSTQPLEMTIKRGSLFEFANSKMTMSCRSLFQFEK